MPPARLPPSLASAVSEGVCLVLVLVIPSFFNLTVNRVFEEEKALLLRSAALLLGGLALAGARWPRASWRHPVVVAFSVLSAVLLAATLTGLSPTTRGGACITGVTGWRPGWP